MHFEVSGEPIHSRCLTVAFRQGEGGSIDFRADILDLRKSGLMELADRITTAGIIHKMELRGAFASDTGRLEHLEWDQSHVMHEANPATRGECCRDPMPRLAALVGTQLGDGFRSGLKQCFGGPLGCTHVNTLFQELSAFVARLLAARARNAELAGERTPGERIASRSLFFDALGAASGDTTSISVRLADIHFGPLGAGPLDAGRERLFSHEEARLVAEAQLAGWQLRSVRAGARRRKGPAFEAAPWEDRSGLLDDFAGRSLGGGLARFCLERFGEEQEHAQLLSALLCLGPGMTQVGAAISDSLAPSSAARPEGSGLTGPGPCYMLRAEGPLMESIHSGRLQDTAVGEGD